MYCLVYIGLWGCELWLVCVAEDAEHFAHLVQDQDEEGEDKSEKPSFKISILICLIGGLVMGCWSPIAAWVMDKDDDGKLTAQFTLFCVWRAFY